MRRSLPPLVLGVLLCALLGAAGVATVVQRQLTAPLALRDARLLDVPPGATLRQVLAGLAADGDLAAPRTLELWARFTGEAERMQAGEYRLEPGLRADELVTLLAEGRVHGRRLVVVEGWRFAELRAALRGAPRLEQAAAALDDAALMRALGRPGVAPEGRFFPDTYVYAAGDTDLDVLRQAGERMDAVLAEEWRGRLGGLPLADADEALVLASLVEKETGAAADRSRIAGVFTRRLERGMRLQTDPAVIYGLGDAFDGNLTRAHLRDPHPWNTYVHRGLPPTPIALPGRAAIRAALHPAEGDALYFVARGDGTSQFSATLEEHNAAVRRFQIEARAADYRSAPAPERR